MLPSSFRISLWRRAMGIEVIAGRQDQVPNPLETPSDLARITLPADSAAAKALVDEKLSHVIAAVQLMSRSSTARCHSLASAAPWTLFYYMVGGSSKKGQELGGSPSTRRLPPRSSTPLSSSSSNTSPQADNGAHILQLFEAMGDFITPPSMEAAALPRMKNICDALKERHPDVPLMVFPRGASYALPALGECGFDVLTLDNTANLATCRDELPKVCLQGAFDPALLIRDNGSDEAKVQAGVKEMLDQLGSQKLIANLREGLSGKEDPALVAAFVEAVHAYEA